MRMRMLAALILATVAFGPASAQDNAQRGGIRTETMSRLAGQGQNNDLIWNIVGLLGLLGVTGLRGEHADDSYHPAPVE
jgi:hypothetical protein